MQQMLKVNFLLFLFLLCCVCAQQCDTFKPTDLLQSGVYDLQLSALTQQNNNYYRVPINNYNTLPNSKIYIALSTQNIKNYNSSEGIEYYIKGYPESSGIRNVIIQTFVLKGKSWSSIRISYIISSSPFFILGFYIQNPSKNQFSFAPKSIQVPLDKTKLNSNEKYSAEVFISGLTTSATEFSVRLYDKIVDEQSANLKINIIKFSKTPVSNIYLHYIVYQVSQSVFMFDKNLPTYFIAGSKQINNKEVIQDTFSVCRKRDICLQNQVLVSEFCQCKAGFTRIGGVCRQFCQQNAIFNDARECICLGGYQRIGSKCSKCESGSYFDEISQQCNFCGQFCKQCNGPYACDICQNAFNLVTDYFFELETFYCQSICGDGLQAIIEQCDDGNNQNGDGCDDSCEIQEKWSCYGGTSEKSSQCQPYKTGRTYINITRTIVLSNQASVQFYLSSLPSCIDKKCANCLQVFYVKVLYSQIELEPSFQYFGDLRFILSFKFGGKRLLNQFAFELGFNENLKSKFPTCLTADDYKPIFTRIIDPANT